MSFCPTCTRSYELPYRRQDASGKIVEGCVDKCHTGHLYGNSLAWHERKEAKAIRKSMADHRKRVLGKL
jgi:hypothetical protein